MTWLPTYEKQDTAYNFVNKEFRKKRFQNVPMSNKIHNKDFSFNGARGKMRHTKSDVVKVAGSKKLRKEKIEKPTDIDTEKVIEKTQLIFKGSDVRGLQKTNKKEAIAWLKKNGNKIKYNRGKHRRSGLYSGGLMMRKYEELTKRLDAQRGEKEVVVDEFANLQQNIQDTIVPNNQLKISSSGL